MLLLSLAAYAADPEVPPADEAAPEDVVEDAVPDAEAEPVSEPEPEPDPLDKATPAELVAEAWRRIERRDYEGGRIIATQLHDRDGADLEEAKYLLAFAWEFDGKPAEAVPIYDDVLKSFPTGKRHRDTTYRRAEALAAMGRHEEALAVVRAFRPYKKLDEVSAYKLALVDAIWTLESRRAAGKKPKKGVKAITKALKKTPADKVTFYQGMARTALVDLSLDQASKLTLQTPKTQVKELEQRAQLIVAMEDQLAAQLDLDEPAWILGSLLLVGNAYEAGGDVLVDAPVPQLTADQQELYRQAIRQKAENAWIKGIKYYQMGIDYADRLQWDGRRLDALQSAHDALTTKIESTP